MIAACLNLLYAALLLVASPWLLWRAWTTGRYREGFAMKLLGAAPQLDDRPRVWFHAVSVGEVNLLAPLIKRLRGERPDLDCVVSTTTVTGFALARTKYPDLIVFYAPLDFSWSVTRALRRIRPSLLVFAELEVWPNWIRAARRLEIPTAIINGRLSARSHRGYRRIPAVLRPMWRAIDLSAVQNDEYAARFRDLGVRNERLIITGSIKFDGVQSDRHNPQTTALRHLAGLLPTERVVLAGSTQAPEERLALAAFQACLPQHPELRLILVPRHRERFDDVARELDASGVRYQRRSRLDVEGADPAARVLLVDTIGELGAWWGTADVAFVGGSLSTRGGQNMLEPAAYGAAVSFGPNTQNFRAIVESLLNANAATVVHDGAELAAFVRRCLDEPQWAADLGSRARALVVAQQGATTRTLAALAPFLPAVAAPLREASPGSSRAA